MPSTSAPRAARGRTASQGRRQPVRFASLRDHLPWIALAAALLGAAFSWSRPSAIALGWLAAFLFLAGFASAGRRLLGLLPFRRARPVFLSHAWLPIAGLAVAALHAGRIPMGPVGQGLLLGFALSVLSGLLLGVVNAAFKRGLAALEDEPLLPEDILEARERSTVEIADLLATSRLPLRDALERLVLRRLGPLRVVLGSLRGRLGLEALRLRVERRALADAAELPREDQAVLRRAVAVEVERRSLELQSWLHSLRQAWVTAHIALAALTLGLLGLHVALGAAY